MIDFTNGFLALSFFDARNDRSGSSG